MIRLGVAAVALIAAAPAFAGDTVKYAAAPEWIDPLPPIDVAKLTDSTPIVVRLDSQQRIDGATVWRYFDTATRASSVEALGQLGTVSLSWQPDQGDLIIHAVEILRGTERIDLLKVGAKFEVLRREQQLERNVMTGALTATLAVQGLRVGDVLRVVGTITQTDANLGGRTQTLAPAFATPFQAVYARSRISWPVAQPVAWRIYQKDVTLQPKDAGGYRTLEVKMPLPKPEELPDDAPPRFTRPPFFEVTSFTDWAEISRVMAPLYATESAIPAGSALAGEVAKIAAAERDPLRRAERALELVQREIRYLLLGMNGGNYRPQTPEKTWEVRYGDCKAKSLLLLSLLRALGIEAEPALVSATQSDLVKERLPMPGAFDHVIVRATIDGRELWLDGTATGARIEDIGDAPPWRYALPVRAAGAELATIKPAHRARPDLNVTIDLDQRAGMDMPALFTVRAVARGPMASMLTAAVPQMTEEQKKEMTGRAIAEYVNESVLTSYAITSDAAAGTVTVTASGIEGTRWTRDERQRRLTLDRWLDKFEFTPDRARPAWQAIPVGTANPFATQAKTTMLLPIAADQLKLNGGAAVSARLAGRQFDRQVTLSGSTATITEAVESDGSELPAAELPAVRERLALAKDGMATLRTTGALQPRWMQVRDGRRDGRFKPLLAAYAKVLANDPKDPEGYQNRASFLRGTFAYADAIADLNKQIALNPTPSLYISRAYLYVTQGDVAKALADAEAARALDPASSEVVGGYVEMLVRSKKYDQAMTLIQARIDQGGAEAANWVRAKADVLARRGDATGAIATLDAALKDRPGNPELLNALCWTKGTRNVALDTALRQCTKAIELADNAAPVLDSRALIYFRMGRMDDALADLDAALDQAESQAGSLFLRAVIRKQLGRTAEAASDIEGARLISPAIDDDYKAFGVSY